MILWFMLWLTSSDAKQVPPSQAGPPWLALIFIMLFIGLLGFIATRPTSNDSNKKRKNDQAGKAPDSKDRQE